MRVRTLLRQGYFGKLALVTVVSLGWLPGLLSAKKFTLDPAPIVPGATGQVKTGKDRNGNTKVDLRVKHLAAPDKLTPPKSTYLIWFQEKGGSPEVQGKLIVNRNLEGRFTTSTPTKVFDMFITAESDANLKAPAGAEVLRSDNVSQ